MSCCCVCGRRVISNPVTFMFIIHIRICTTVDLSYCTFAAAYINKHHENVAVIRVVTSFGNRILYLMLTGMYSAGHHTFPKFQLLLCGVII